MLNDSCKIDASVKSFLIQRFWNVEAVFAGFFGLLAVASRLTSEKIYSSVYIISAIKNKSIFRFVKFDFLSSWAGRPNLIYY